MLRFTLTSTLCYWNIPKNIQTLATLFEIKTGVKRAQKLSSRRKKSALILLKINETNLWLSAILTKILDLQLQTTTQSLKKDDDYMKKNVFLLLNPRNTRRFSVLGNKYRALVSEYRRHRNQGTSGAIFEKFWGTPKNFFFIF